MEQMEQVAKSEKKFKRNYILYAVLFVIILILSALAITFAFFDATNEATGTTNAQMSLDCINISYNEEDIINLDYQYPVSDEYAISNIQPVTVTVENHCSNNIDAISYAITLSSLANATGFIPDTKVRVYATKQINNGTENVIQIPSYLSDVSIINDSYILSNLTTDLNSRENIKDYDAKRSYMLYSDYINDKEIHTFKVYFWIDYYEGDRNMYDKTNYPDYEHDKTFDNTTEGLEFAAAISLYVNPTAEKRKESICTYDETSTVAEGLEGAKYNCKVDPNKDEYTFYILDINEDGTSDLIMNANINASGEAVIPGVTSDTGLVVWLSRDRYDSLGGPDLSNDGGFCQHVGECVNTIYGPVTAMEYLHNATKSWTNVEPLNYEYYDRQIQGITTTDKGYESFVSTNGIALITAGDTSGTQVTIGTTSEPLRSRMTIYSSDTNVTEVTSKTESNSYLFTNSDPDIGIHGYWTLSSDALASSSASIVHFGGTGNTRVDRENWFGVRPVITVKL